MLILPALDLMGGRCVRLWKGDFERPTVYSSSPAAVAQSFLDTGFGALHVVDLDGAKEGKIKNLEALSSILVNKKVRIQVGGGVRRREDIETLITLGAERIVIGSMAILGPDTVLRWINDFGPSRFVIAIDIRQGRVALSGWKRQSELEPSDVIRQYVNAGVQSFLCTDIERDGTLSGPNIDLYAELLASFPNAEIQASGGIATIADVKALSDASVPAVIIGKALYEGNIDLEDLKPLSSSTDMKRNLRQRTS